MERIVSTMVENLDGENVVRVWKDYITEDAIIVLGKKPWEPSSQTIPAGENCIQMLCMT